MKLLLFIFYLSSVALSPDFVLAGVLECTQNEDCIANDATCVEELCTCPHGKEFSLDGLRCLELVIGYESACEDDAQCGWLLGKHECNLEKKCICAEGWRYHNGRCIIAKALSEKCTRNEDCFVSNDIYSMVCSEGICACSEGYYERGGYDCRPIGTKPGDFCALDMDCQFENAYCDRSWCEYKSRRYNAIEEESEIQVFSSPKKAYELGSSCSTSQECTDANSFCSPLTKTCTCIRGYFLHASGECIAELGIDIGCHMDSDCNITPRRCVNGTCVCPLTHYFGRGRNKCVKVSFSPDFACVNDEWCSIFGSGATCVGTDETYCRCPSGMQLDQNSLCRRVSGGGCVVNSDCYMLQNSICQNSQCVCPPNHRAEENACLPNIGGQCSQNSQCLIEHTECQEGTCTCEDNYIANGELECIEVTGGLESRCNSDLQCSLVVENSECSDGICNCKVGYQVNDDGDGCFEVKLMGDYCVLPIQCHVLLGNNVQCRNSICQCSADMEVTPDGLDCRYPNAAPSGRYASSSFLITLALLCIAGY